MSEPRCQWDEHHPEFCKEHNDYVETLACRAVVKQLRVTVAELYRELHGVRERFADALTALSGKTIHASDCATRCAPAEHRACVIVRHKMTCSRCDSEMEQQEDGEDISHVCPFCGRVVSEDGETVERGR